MTWTFQREPIWAIKHQGVRPIRLMIWRDMLSRWDKAWFAAGKYGLKSIYVKILHNIYTRPWTRLCGILQVYDSYIMPRLIKRARLTRGVCGVRPVAYAAPISRPSLRQALDNWVGPLPPPGNTNLTRGSAMTCPHVLPLGVYDIKWPRCAGRDPRFTLQSSVFQSCLQWPPKLMVHTYQRTTFLYLSKTSSKTNQLMSPFYYLS